MDENKETITLTKQSTGRKTAARTVDKERILKGYESKHKIEFKIGKKSVYLVSRNLYSTGAPEMLGIKNEKTIADNYAKALTIMKQRSIPVVNTVRTISAHKVAVTDIEAEGSVILDTKGALTIRRNEDRIALERLKTLDVDEFKEKANSLAQLATNKAVLLPHDGPFHVVFSANGDFRLMVLDVHTAIVGDNNKTLADKLKADRPWHTSWRAMDSDSIVQETNQKYVDKAASSYIALRSRYSHA